jgi:hypothetical protein
MPASHTHVNVVLAARDTARPRTSRARSADLAFAITTPDRAIWRRCCPTDDATNRR